MAKQYIEHEKLDTERLRAIDELIEWLDVKGYSIVNISDVGHYTGTLPVGKWEDLRLEFFGADPKMIELERVEMLKNIE
jgi:hypothetical protein